MAEKKEGQGKGYDQKTIAIASAIIIVLLAGAAYYAGAFTPSTPPVQPAPPSKNGPDMNAPDVQLFLSYMRNEAALSQEYVNYTDSNDGAVLNYEIAANQTDGWVKETGGYGSFEGYFGADNSSYVICLNYENKLECTKTGADATLLGIASRLKSRLPDSSTSLANLQFSQKLIAAGAMKFPGTVENGSVNGFDTRKVSYTLDYSNLTVQTLQSLGIQPNDPSLFSITGWSVTNWIDSKTGQLVRSSNTYTQSGVQHAFGRNVVAIQTGGVTPPSAPATLVGSAEFAQFYQNAESEYSQMQDCFTNNESDVSSCLKGIASENGDFRICRLITDDTQRWQCMLVVAQTTADASLCPLSGALADDCYISVVSQTGNASLCAAIQNASLLQTCYKAKLAGDQIAAGKQAEVERLIAGENCAVDKDCGISGNQNQYCVPANSTKPLGNETSPEFACLQGVPCGCVGGYCGFKENESAGYAKCVDDAENQQIGAYIKSLAQASAAANRSNSAPGTGAGNSSG